MRRALRRSRLIPTLAIACVAATSSGQVPPPAPRVPSDTERLVIDSGRPLVREEKVAESPWPRVSVYQFIEATPEEAAAVFFDYSRHSTYIPGIRRSVISRALSPAVAEVDYVLAVPLYADEHYTVRDSLSRSADGGSYRIDWRKVRARSTKEIIGSATFEPYRNARTGADGTLLTYVNLVVPGQFLAGPFKGRALDQVRKTVVALVQQVDAQRRSDPTLLAEQVAALAAAARP